MKVDNIEIAKIVFFKLYHRVKNYRAAAKLASNIIDKQSLLLNLGDTDHLIEMELEHFGCTFFVKRSGDFVSFDLTGKTEIDPDKWQKLCQEIYN